MSVSESSGSGAGSVMGAVDDAEFVIADVATEDAWLSVAIGDAWELDGWR